MKVIFMGSGELCAQVERRVIRFFQTPEPGAPIDRYLTNYSEGGEGSYSNSEQPMFVYLLSDRMATSGC